MMRVAVGGIDHETSTFTPVPTTLDDFRRRFLLEGAAVVDTFQGTNTEIGGFVAALERQQAEVVPTMFAEAHPGAPVARRVFEELLNALIKKIDDAAPLDGVLLDLHGAMVAEGEQDPESTILRSVREVVGENVPIIVQLDIHANVSRAMVDEADALIARETYPEIDMAERGEECADLLLRTLRGEVRPTGAVCQMPFIWGTNQVTAEAPMRDAIDALHALEALPGVLTASICTGYPFADVPDMGSSVIVVTNDDQGRAQALADELGGWLDDRREDWFGPMPATADLIPTVAGDGRHPVIFADREDNTGAGTPGDSTGMLRAFLAADLVDACVLYIVDPASIRTCEGAGVGATVELAIGGKSDPDQGAPVCARAEVLALSDGGFLYSGPMYHGLSGSMGPSAHVKVKGVHILLVTEREQPFDPSFARSLQLDVDRMRFVGVKSQAHFRAGLGAFASAIHVVRESSVHNPPSGPLVYRNLGRPLFPIISGPEGRSMTHVSARDRSSQELHDLQGIEGE
jgi:microcystin degradation protein MlrC